MPLWFRTSASSTDCRPGATSVSRYVLPAPSSPGTRSVRMTVSGSVGGGSAGGASGGGSTGGGGAVACPSAGAASYWRVPSLITGSRWSACRLSSASGGAAAGGGSGWVASSGALGGAAAGVPAELGTDGAYTVGSQRRYVLHDEQKSRSSGFSVRQLGQTLISSRASPSSSGQPSHGAYSRR